MKKSFFSLTLALAALSLSGKAEAAVNVQTVGGWFESGYVTWTAEAPAYNVYYAQAGSTSFTQLDKELIREYPGYVRADVLGTEAGDYQFKIVPVSGGTELTSEATLTTTFTATAHDRSGFAHVGMSEGIGAYQNNGALKPGAKVLYVWADNAWYTSFFWFMSISYIITINFSFIAFNFILSNCINYFLTTSIHINQKKQVYLELKLGMIIITKMARDQAQ